VVRVGGVRGPAAIALTAAIGGALLVPSVPLAEDPPQPPTAVLESASNTVEAGTVLKLDSSKSTAGSGAIVGHVWDLDGNGSFETDTGPDPLAEVKPEQAGPLKVQVRVVDDRGLNADANLDLTVSEPPAEPKAIDAPAPATPPKEVDQAPAEPATEPDPERPAPEQAAPEPTATVKPAKSADAAPPAPSAARMSAAPTLLPKTVLARTRPVANVHAAASGGVTIKDFKYAPASISVSVGDSITWTNQDIAPHTATANDGSFDTGSLSKGKSGSVTFSKAGTFPYICSIHPSMKGTVTVAAAGGGGAGDSGSGTGGTSDNTATDTGSGLPHTGLDLLAVVLLAGLMSATGSLIRWRLGPAE
jgi:plastocyanin